MSNLRSERRSAVGAVLRHGIALLPLVLLQLIGTDAKHVQSPAPPEHGSDLRLSYTHQVSSRNTPPRPSYPASTALRVRRWSNHTYHHAVGDTWPCTSLRNGSQLCIAGDITLASADGRTGASCPGSGPGQPPLHDSGMSAWRVQGVPSPEIGYSGSFSMERVSGYCDFAPWRYCKGTRVQSMQTKPSAVIRVNSTLALGVSCMTYGFSADNRDPFHRQTNLEAYIATSSTDGVTWEQGAAEQRQRPFKGRLAAPMFLQHEPLVPGDGHDTALDGWIYAYFAYDGNSSYWNNNDAMLLGRVRSTTLLDLQSLSSWMFYCAPPASRSERWCRTEVDATPVFQYEKMVGENLVTYNAATGRYLFANYGFYDGETNQPRSWFSPTVDGRRWSQLTLFESAHAWGPWSLVYLEDDWRGDDAGYTPTLPSAWLTRNGDELKGVMVHSGWWDDYNFAAQPFVLSILQQPEP